MRKKRIKLILVFVLSVALTASFQALSFTQEPGSSNSTSSTFFDNSFWQNVAITVLSAVLAFLGGYTLSSISRRSGSGKKLSYSSNVETGLINVEKNIKDKVKVLYEGNEIANLSNIQFDIENTGNSVIKSQEIRFEFTSGTNILEFYFDPQPQPEMQVEKLSDSALRDSEAKCKIGHIEKGQKIGIHFIVTSESEIKLTPYPYNENGDVEFNSRAVTKELGERGQVARFLSLLIMYFVIPPVFPLAYPSSFGGAMAGLTKLVILMGLFRFIVPFSEVMAELITKYLNASNELAFRQSNIENSSIGGDLNMSEITQAISRSKDI